MKNLLFVVTHKKDYFIPKLEMYKSIAVGPNKSQIESDYRDDKNIEMSNKNPLLRINCSVLDLEKFKWQI